MMRREQAERLAGLLEARHQAQGTPGYAAADALVQACGRNCTDDETKWARIAFIHGIDPPSDG